MRTNRADADAAVDRLSRFADETAVIWEASEGQISNAGVFLACLLTCWLLLPIGYALLRAWRTANHRYSLTDQRLQERYGLIGRQVEHLELYRVKDISVHIGLLQRLVGRGSITLFTSDHSSPVVQLVSIPDPEAVSYLLRTCVERCRVAKGVREIDGQARFAP